MAWAVRGSNKPELFGAGREAATCALPGAADAAVVSAIAEQARQMGASDRVVLAMFETAWVESGARNRSDKTRWNQDSLGVFQQRTSWGSKAVRLDPKRSAALFLERAMNVDRDPKNARLTAGQLAQKVQVSAYPARYDQAEATANPAALPLGVLG